jgi:hypothetical protein
MALERGEWNAIRDLVLSMLPSKTMSFAKVIKRDEKKKLIWTKEYGKTAIPLVDFERSFQYYDTQPTGANVAAGVPLPTKLVKKEDKLQKNPNLLTAIVVPRVGQTVIILEQWGNQRAPICIGVILSTGHWEGEE